MNRFWELLRDSVLVQAGVALILTTGVTYMYAVGRDVPEGLTTALGIVLGFYFGAKTQVRLAGGK